MSVLNPTPTLTRRRHLGRIRAAMLVAVPAVLLAACAPAALNGTQGYEVVFYEDFEGTTLDALWQVAPHDPSAPRPALANGSMIVTATSARNGFAMTTGPRRAQEPNFPNARSWQYGYFEARLRFTDSAWAWPTFWMFSMAKSEAWPQEICPPQGEYTSEWNIMEGGLDNRDGTRPASRSVYSVLHRNTANGSAGPWCDVPDSRTWTHYVSPDANLSGWHTWGGLWTEEEVCLYLDEREIGCRPTYDSTHQPMHIILSIGYHGLCGGCPAKPARLQMEVAWVRVWQQR